MTLCIALFELPEGGLEALEASVWELSESHCMLANAMLVQTSVSPRYLHSHIVRALRRAGLEGSLLVTAVTSELHIAGMDPAVALWVEEGLAAQAE